MSYELRHDFMGNAINEATAMTNGEAYRDLISTNITTYSWLKTHWSLKEHNDWFAMYVMGGVPFPQHNRL